MRLSQKITQLGTLEKIVATGGVLIGAAAIVGAGAFATFTSTGTASVTADAGQLDVTVVSDSTLIIANMVPGDVVYKAFNVDLSGTNLFSALDFFVEEGTHSAGADPESSATSQLLDSTGLRYEILTCPVAWTAAVSPAGPTCGTTGSPRTLLTTQGDGALSGISGSSAAVALTAAALGLTEDSNGMIDTAGVTKNLHSMIKITLPSSASNSFQNASTHLTFKVIGTARDATVS